MNTNCIKQVALNTIETAFADKKRQSSCRKADEIFFYFLYFKRLGYYNWVLGIQK